MRNRHIAIAGLYSCTSVVNVQR